MKKKLKRLWSVRTHALFASLFMGIDADAPEWLYLLPCGRVLASQSLILVPLSHSLAGLALLIGDTRPPLCVPIALIAQSQPSDPRIAYWRTK